MSNILLYCSFTEVLSVGGELIMPYLKHVGLTCNVQVQSHSSLKWYNHNSVNTLE